MAPPGTGKTYHTAVRALGILSGKSDQQIKADYSREQIRQELDKYRSTGQLEFVTFHQAFSYEDFVEGIKPVIAASDTEEGPEENQSLRYEIERGIFRILAERSAYALFLQQRQRLVAGTPSTSNAPPDFDTVFEALRQQWQQQLDQEKEVALKTPGAEIILQSISNHGTFYFKYRKSKTDNKPQVTRKTLRGINDSNPHLPATPGTIPVYEVNHGRDRTVYRAVFRELRKLEQQMSANASHHLPAGPSLTEALQRAVVDPEIAAENVQGFDYKSLEEKDLTQAPRFVLIIDEINRGNVANIFGELITLIEKDKRAGQLEMLTAKLPYSKSLFTVPDNLYLLGTMNTADRSVEALDTALRRRFSFTEMRPDADVIRKHVGSNGVVGTGTDAINVAQILEVLNSRLEQLLDHDHCLGHALLLDAQSLDSLRTSFEHGIIPLLQEYFFADWGKIGLVLGTEFVKVIKPNTPGRRKLAVFPGYDSHGMGERPIYRLTSPDAWTAAAFQSIYA
jgi:5-methylcytosine-specific restriction protein B